MTGLRTRKTLNDYANRRLFLQAPWYVRLGRWVRRNTFGRIA